MTTTDTHPAGDLDAAAGPRLLRRSRTSRVAAGVSGGLGEYFGLDPVLFRVLFATSAFFGGAGILAYLLAWAAIPEAGTDRAPLDGWMASLRRRRAPVWAVALIGGAVLWLAAFSWWAPGPFVPVVVAGVIIVVLLGRRGALGATPGPPGDAGDANDRVSLTKDAGTGGTSAGPSWPGDARAWMSEARAAGRARARRALPVKLGALITLVAVLTTLGVIDAASGVGIQYYFWATLGIVAAGLLVGLVLRRTPWSIALLVPVAVVGVVAFAGSHARLHDGVGQRTWTPATAGSSVHYRLALGRGELDLSQLPTSGAATRIDVTVGAGEVHVIAPTSLRLTVQADVHIGQIDVDGHRGRRGDGGVGVSRTVRPPAGASGRAVTVDIHLADGRILVEHR